MDDSDSYRLLSSPSNMKNKCLLILNSTVGRLPLFYRAASRQGFTTKNYSVGTVSQLSDFSQQVGWQNQIMISRLDDLGSGARSETNQPPPGRAGPAKI